MVHVLGLAVCRAQINTACAQRNGHGFDCIRVRYLGVAADLGRAGLRIPAPREHQDTASGNRLGQLELERRTAAVGGIIIGQQGEVVNASGQTVLGIIQGLGVIDLHLLVDVQQMELHTMFLGFVHQSFTIETIDLKGQGFGTLADLEQIAHREHARSKAQPDDVLHGFPAINRVVLARDSCQQCIGLVHGLLESSIQQNRFCDLVRLLISLIANLCRSHGLVLGSGLNRSSIFLSSH